MDDPSQRQKAQPASFKDALKFWTKLGFISFGGPAGQIAIMHKEVVETRNWLGENQFLRALNFCMLLPGPEAQQLATYMGWRLHGIWGGIAAGTLFVVPSIFVILFLSYLAVAHIDLPVVAAAFYGIQPVVVAVVAEAVIRIGKKALRHGLLYGFAAAAFASIFFFNIAEGAIYNLNVFNRQLFQPHKLDGIFKKLSCMKELLFGIQIGEKNQCHGRQDIKPP